MEKKPVQKRQHTPSRKLGQQSQNDQYLQVLALKETPVGIAILSGKKHIITFANHLFCRFTGKTYRHLINKSVWQAIPEVKGQGFEKLLSEVLLTGIPYIGSESPVHLKRRGKFETGYFSFVFNPIRDSEGKINEIMIIATEVTDKVKINQAVQKEREYFYEIFMQAPAVIAVLKGPNHIIDLVNPLAQQAVGLKRDVVGKTISEAMPEIKAQGFIQILNTVYKTGKPFIGNEIETKVDLEETGMLVNFYYNFVFQPDFTIQGKIQGVFVYAVNVTEEVLSRRKIEEKEKLLINILESISDAFISYDKNWCFTYVNQEASNILDKKPEELLGRSVWEIFPELINTEAGKNLIKAVKKEIPIFFQTYYSPFQKWFDVRIYPSKDGITTTFRDVTQNKLLEQQKEEFLGVASHELKTPVTSLKAFTQVMQNRFSKGGDDASVQLLEKMNTQINKLSILIQGLLDVSRIERGKLSLQKRIFYLDELIEEIVEEVQLTTETQKIVIKNKARIEIGADRERIGQVLTNLLTNAVKYTQKISKIIVSSKVNKNMVVISVKDFGIGIAKDNLPNVFDKFFRVSGNLFNTVPGMGLGLNIASEIIKRHNGKIWVKSIEGKGTTFSFSLPFTSSKNSKYI